MVHARKMRWLTYHPAADLDSPEQRRSSRPRPTTAAQRTAAGLEAITLGKLRHCTSRMRAAGIAADVVAAWHGHTERMTQAVYGRVTDDRLTAAADVFSAPVGQI